MLYASIIKYDIDVLFDKISNLQECNWFHLDELIFFLNTYTI